MTDILDDLSRRGLLALSTDQDELRNALRHGPVTFYGGFDPTAPGLHIGNLVPLLTMRRLQRAGHRPIGLVGGATGLIGDPSGKSAERMLNPRDVVAGWVARIRSEVERFLDFAPGPTGALLVSNLDWTQDLTALDFLRDIGKHFPVNQMLAREAVKARLEAGGISYTEFSYQILQAYDYLELHRRQGCTLQLGGSDQWGNLVAGVDLIRRVTGDGVHALATPLITKPDGTKYGKTDGGAIWISPDLMSPYAFYQFWINRTDAEVGNLLRVFTFRPHEEIEALERQVRDKPAAREAQRVLAQDVTALVHGEAECAKAIAASEALFGRGDLAGLDGATLAAALAEAGLATVKLGPATPDARGPATAGASVTGGAARVPVTIEGPAGPVAAEAEPGRMPSVVDLLTGANVVTSKSAARRAIAEGGAYLNNRKVTSQDAVPDRSDLLHGRFLVLRRGKRTVGGVEVTR